MTTSGAPRLGGVSLEQFAGVTAAVDDGIPLAAVLVQEQIAAPAWARAELAWREALADATDLQLAYLHRRREAEDCLRRAIAPLDDDPAAWSGLLGALALSGDPQGQILDPLGLRMSDVGRLGRRWTQKAIADERLVTQLNELAGKHPPPATVQCSPLALRPFPWTPASAGATAPSAAREDTSAPREGFGVEDDVDAWAALSVVLELAPTDRGIVLGLCGLDEARLAAVAEVWAERLEDQEPRAGFTVSRGEHRGALRQLLAGARGRIAD